MIQNIINTPSGSGLGDKLNVAFQKVNENFQFLSSSYASTGSVDSLQNQINSVSSSLSNYSLVGHTHTISEIIGLQTQLNSFVQSSTFNQSISLINQSIVNINSLLTDINVELDSKLSNDISTYSSASIPPTGIENAIIEQGGTFKKINVRDLSKLEGTTFTSGSGVTMNVDTTKFDIHIVGVIVNPITFIKSDINVNLTGISATYIGTQTESYIWVNSIGNVIQSLTPPVETDLDTIIGYWVVVHNNLTNINVINSFPLYTDGVGVQLQQALTFDGFRKKQNSNIVSPGTTGTRISHTGGLVIKAGGGASSKRPVFSLNGVIDATFKMRNRNDNAEADTQTFDVTNIDIAGVTTPLGNNRFGAAKVWKFSSSLIRIQRGQHEYQNYDAALKGKDLDTYVDSPNGERNGIHIGWIVFKKGTTWAGGTEGVDYKFVDVIDGRSSGSSGILNTLQTSYNISTQPQITTDAIKGALQVKGGTGVDTDNIWEGKNNSGSITSFIKANGQSSFTTGSFTGSFTGSLFGTASYVNVTSSLGYIPENVVNKVTTLVSANNTTYPTTLLLSSSIANISGGNDIVITKFFPAYPLAPGGFTTGSWYSFQYPNSFIEAPLNSGLNYGTGSLPSGTPSIVIPSLYYVIGKKIRQISWHTDYCDQVEFGVCVDKYDLIAGTLVNKRNILNQLVNITLAGPVTQNAVPFNKNKLTWTTSDIVDTPVNAQTSVYFLFYKHISTSGGGAGPSYLYFNFN